MNKTILDEKLTYNGIPAYCEVVQIFRRYPVDFCFIDNEGNVKIGRFGEASKDAKIFDEYIKVVVFENRVEATCDGETYSFDKGENTLKDIVNCFTSYIAK